MVTRLRLDYLIGKWWLEGDDKAKKALRNEAAALSQQSSLPCVFTNTVAHEVAIPTNPNKNYSNDNGYAKSNHSSNTKSGKSMFSRTNKTTNTSTSLHSTSRDADMAITSGVLIGAVIGYEFAFGNIGATTGNLGVSR